MGRWQKDRLPMPRGHAWTARPGCSVFIADRGAVRFDIPQDWVTEPGEQGSVRIHDQPPPSDECRLELSVLRLPPGVGPPVADLLSVLEASDDLPDAESSAPTFAHRPNLELAWTESRHRDADTDRAALSRCCIASGRGIYAVLTLSLWADDAPRLIPIWDQVLDTLELGARYDLSGRDARRN